MDIVNWTREFAHRPRWALYRFFDGLRRRSDWASHDTLTKRFPELVVPLLDALSTLLSTSKAEIEGVLARYQPPELAEKKTAIPASWGASTNLLQTYFALCTVFKPKLVVETGVATGISSALLLRELSRNGDARLISVEFPGLGRLDVSYIGNNVPQHLKRHWTLIVAPAVHALSSMRDMAGKVDIFIHDSDHSYDNQLREYRLALTLLRPGGVLVSDDVANDAFLEICEQAGTLPIIVHRKKDHGYIGLTRMPIGTQS